MRDSRSRTHPGSPPTLDRRLDPRVPVRPVEYIEFGENNGGIILNISGRGMAVSAAQPLRGDQTLSLRFQLPGFPNSIETMGEISWIDESQKRAGILFVDLPESAREQIDRWISLRTAAAPSDRSAPGIVRDSAPPSLLTATLEQTDRPSRARNGNVLSKMASTFSVTPQEAERETGENTPAGYDAQTASDGTKPAAERRGRVRKSVNASAYLRLHDGNAGLVANLSETGLSFRAARTLESDRIFVRFQLPGSDGFIESPALIVWKSASKKKIGARFVGLPDEARNQIVEWIGSRTVPKSAHDPREQSSSVTKTSEVGASPADLTAALKAVQPVVSTFKDFSTPERSDYLDAKPEEVGSPAEPPDHADLQLPAFLAPQTPLTPDRRSGGPVSPESAWNVADSVPPFYRAYPLGVAPKESRNFWRIATLMILIGGACFGGGIYFSRNRQISGSSYENLNQGQDTISAPQSSQSERSKSDSSTKPSSATQAAPANTGGSGRTMHNAERQRSEQVISLGDSGSSKSALSIAPVANRDSKQSGRPTTSTEPATTREKAGNFAVPANTRSGNQGAAARRENAPARALLGADETSKLESEASARLNQESKPAASPEPPQQTHVASSPAASDPSAATRVPSTAASNPTIPAPVRNLMPSVSFLSRFRSIRASSNPSNLSSSGELQIGPLRSSPVPAYPVEAQQRQLQGIVELDVMVGSSGEVQSVRLVKGPVELAGAATNAVRSWQFAPTLLGGHPVETEQSIIFTFKLGS